MSTLKLDTIASRDGTESTDVTNVINGSAKAWVNFDGTGTVAIRDSFNVGSITDNGTGNYTVNFTNAMTDTNYSAQVRAALTNYNISQAGNTTQVISTTTYSPGTFYINGSNSSYSFSAGDPTHVYIAIFR